MRPLYLTCSLVLLTFVPACGDGPTDSAKEKPATEITLDKREVTLTEIGQSAQVRATAGSQSTTAPTLTVAAEARWLDDMGVLDPAALAAGEIHAAAPGTARLSVAAFGLPAKEVVVKVEPTPYVARYQITGESVRLRGYRLHEVASGSLAWDGVPATLIAKDSANLTVSAPGAASGACLGGGNAVLTMTAGAASVRAEVRRPRAGEVTLGVGEFRRMSAEEVACLRLAPAPGAQYAVAYLDLRAIERARSDGREGEVMGRGARFAGVSQPVASASLAVAPNFSAGASRAASQAGHIDLRPHFSQSASGSASVYAPRAAPWKVGDTFSYWPSGYAGEATGVVVKVYEGGYVLATMEDARDLLTPAWIAEFDASVALMHQRGDAYLRRVTGASRPETAPGTGQFLVVAVRGAGTGYADGRLVALKVDPSGNTYAASKPLVAHEMAHVAQMSMRDRPAVCASSPVCFASMTTWGAEGGADFLAHEILREAAGVAPDGNVPFEGGADRRFMFEPGAVNGRFVRGYLESANYFRHLVWMLSRGGMERDAAIRLVVLATLEGWDGFDVSGTRHPEGAGMVSRVRPHLGADWTPEGSILQWTLALWADDRTSNPLLQEPLLKYAHGEHKSGTGLNAGALDGRAGGGVERAYDVAGGHGVFVLSDDSFGGSYTFTTDALAAGWMIARIK